MQYQSIVQVRNPVVFPDFIGERVYMREFYKKDGLPPDLRDRWQGTVDAMLEGVETDGPVYLMVDEGVVKAGDPHRRPGLHIDGYWRAGRHTGHTMSAHGPRHIPYYPPSHRPSGPSHMSTAGKWEGNGDWSWADADFKAPEGLLLASSVTAARAYDGVFTGTIGEGGDCSAVNIEGMEEVPLTQGFCFAGNVSMLHESLPVGADCRRSLVRLNVPGWTVQ